MNNFISLPSGTLINVDLVAFVSVRGTSAAEKARGENGQLVLSFGAVAGGLGGRDVRALDVLLRGGEAEAFLKELQKRGVNTKAALEKLYTVIGGE